MKQYIGTKEVQATPMNRGDYNALRGWQVPENENPADDGYLVVYPNGEPNVKEFNGYTSRNLTATSHGRQRNSLKRRIRSLIRSKTA